jgi:small-conductance mechanosensitive channel
VPAAIDLFGIRLVGFTADNARKLLFTIVFLTVLWGATQLIRWAIRASLAHDSRVAFWTRQFISIASAILTVVGLVSIWFDDPRRAATALGLITAGLAFALQRVVTAIAGYLMILRGNVFNVGDRIKMGGVRGDVIALGFLQTTIMEMGQPPAAQQEDPGMWVEARQYSGRIVSVSNAKIFDEAVYNYTRDFPYLWEEMRVPITYESDRARAEQILIEAAKASALAAGDLPHDALVEMQRRYFMKHATLDPTVYWRLTDNWLELTVRFVVEDHGVREVKDRMSRHILSKFDEAGIGIASSTVAIVQFPPVRMAGERPGRA